MNAPDAKSNELAGVAGITAVLRERVAAEHNRRTEELKREADRAAQRLTERLATAATFRLVLEGSGGGEWHLVVRDGNMRVEALGDEGPGGPKLSDPAEGARDVGTDAEEARPVVTVFQSVEAWQRLLEAGQGFFTAGGGTELNQDRIARLRQLSGAIEFRLTDVDGGDPVLVSMQLGPARERLAATTTITLRADVARRIRAGELPPQQAMMQGLVQLGGDVSLAMQVAIALFM